MKRTEKPRSQTIPLVVDPAWHCSFCGRREGEVTIVLGATYADDVVTICDRCTSLASYGVEARKRPEEPPTPDGRDSRLRSAILETLREGRGIRNATAVWKAMGCIGSRNVVLGLVNDMVAEGVIIRDATGLAIRGGS